MRKFQYKKFLGAALAFAMAANGVPGMSVDAKAASDQAIPEPKSQYDFDGTMPEGAKTITTGLKAYNGATVYGEGHTGKEGDKAILLGDYGVELPDKNIGNNYTVSFWEKATTAPVSNSPVIFLGYNDPEEWVAMSGEGSGYKFWSNSASNGEINWQTFATLAAAKNTWRHIVITGAEGGETSAYCNGELIGHGKEASALDGEKQGILLGVSNWDNEFEGLIDDVRIYNEVLTAEQIQTIYSGKSGEDVLNEKGFEVSAKEITLAENKSKTITLKVPSGVGDYETTFESSDPETAQVYKDGKISGIKAGTATITVTVKKGSVEKSETINVTVTESESDTVNKETALELDFSEIKGNVIADRSGNGNDAEVGGKLSVEDGKLIFDGDGYLNLPVSVMEDLQNEEEFTIETTFTRSESCGNNAWLFNIGSNPKPAGTNYLFLSPAFGGSTLRGGIKNNSNELLLDTGISTVADKEYTAVMVFDNGKVSLYLNGAQIGTTIDSGYSIVEDVIADGCKDNVLGYIAKSCWKADELFRGTVSSFKIVDGAESAESIQKRFSASFQKDFEESLTLDELLSRNASADKVQYDLTLAKEVNENEVTWTSSDPAVITESGKVVNDKNEDKKVTLTAYCSSGKLKAEQKFELTVLKLDRSEVDPLIAEAKNSDGYDSNTALQNAVIAAENASTQTEIKSAIKALNTLMQSEQDAFYKDPFAAIDDSLFPAEKEITVGNTEVLAEIPSKVLNAAKVEVSADNDDVLSVSEKDGVVSLSALKTGVSNVTVSVTADYDGFTIDYETRVKVVDKESSDPVNPGDKKETETTPSAPANNTITDSDTSVVLMSGTTYKVSMSYSVKSYKLDKAEKKIISVAKNGKVKVKKSGTVTLEIIGKKGEFKEVTIYAEKPVGKKTTITAGEKVNVNSLISGVTYSKAKSYKSSKEKVASVDHEGNVTAISKGSAKITVEYGNKKVTVKIRVK